MTGARRVVTAGLLAFGVLGCARRPDPLAQDVASVEERSLAPGARRTSSYSLQREQGAARARWEFQVEMSWEAYADWATAQLAEYRLVERDRYGVHLSRQLEGDVYTLELSGRPRETSLTVHARFEARPF